MTGREDGLYFSQFKPGEAVLAFGIGRVVASKDEKYAKGDIVLIMEVPVAEYAVVPSSSIMRKIDPDSGIPLPEYLGSIGVPGFAASVAVELLGDLKQGSNVFISAAAAGVGMYAGQLAKLRGCRVIRSTGADEKVPTERDAVRNLQDMVVVGKEVMMEEGFESGSYFDPLEYFVKDVEKCVVEGKNRFIESLGSVFWSFNLGKVIITVKP